MKRRELSHKVVMITGAASGIGKALAFRFAAANCNLVLMDMDEESLQTVALELQSSGTEVFWRTGDVSNQEDCFRLVEEATRKFGGIDVLINNAGITHRSAFRNTNMDVYHRVMNVNYFGSVYCTKAAIENLIQRQGMIIVISSIAGFSPLLGRSGYSAAKHALHGFFDSLRTELRGTGVDVLIVCPGFTATNIRKNALGENGKPTDRPQSRIGKSLLPEDVADKIYKSAEKGQSFLVLSKVGKLSYFLTKFYPSLFAKIMARSLRSELERDKTTDH